jgi:hypothetical protein
MKALQIDRDEQEQGTKRGDSTDTQYKIRVEEVEEKK